MRRDMPKVLVERSRTGKSRASFRTRRNTFERGGRDREEPDVTARLMPTGFAGTAHLSENLAPLKRFLQRRVGRRWDDVYAELRAHLAPRRAIDLHVLQHLYHYVARARREAEGIRLYRHDGRPLAWLEDARVEGRFWQTPFYVCCDTGRLLRLPVRARPRTGARAR